MTKREKKYQRRLFAELHADKSEQVFLLNLGIPFFSLYEQYRDVKTIKGIPSEIPVWLFDVKTRVVSRIFNKAVNVLLKLSNESCIAADAINAYKIAVS